MYPEKNDFTRKDLSVVLRMRAESLRKAAGGNLTRGRRSNREHDSSGLSDFPRSADPQENLNKKTSRGVLDPR